MSAPEDRTVRSLADRDDRRQRPLPVLGLDIDLRNDRSVELRNICRAIELEANLKCPRNLLSKRLQTLESHGIVIKTTYKEEKSRTRMAYQLTQPGRDLLPVLIALQNWGDQHLPAVAGQVAAPTDPQCGGRLITQITCANGHAVNL